MRWAFFKWQTISDRDGSPYLVRLRVIQTPWLAVYLHFILREDHDRHLHDHPWNFLTFILRGEYDEQIGSRANLFSTRWFRFHRAEQPHRISHIPESPVVTLCIMGRRRREWGFHTEDGWIPWRSYLVEELTA